MLQTILVPLLVASEPSTIELEGGTHNKAAPSFDFLTRSFLPLIARMGARVEVELVRPGFYPAGGGRIVVTIEPLVIPSVARDLGGRRRDTRAAHPPRSLATLRDDKLMRHDVERLFVLRSA